jgi:hypothetical protein
VIVKGFKKCCITSAGDETDGDMLRKGNEEAGNVRIEREEDEGMTVMIETLALSGKCTMHVREVKIHHV